MSVFGGNFMCLAILSGFVQTLQQLISYDISVNNHLGCLGLYHPQDPDRLYLQTYLTLALHSRKISCLVVLLQSGANPRLKDLNGVSPLETAHKLLGAAAPRSVEAEEFTQAIALIEDVLLRMPEDLTESSITQPR
jgi:hypothetical protein